METILNENTLSNGPKDSSTPKIQVERHERSTLHVLQETATGNITGGKDRVENKKDVYKSKGKALFDNKGCLTSSSNSMKIYEDSHFNSSETGHSVRCSRSVQTEDVLLESYIQNKQFQNASTDSGNLSGFCDQEAYDLMANDNIPETYWKDMAEQRRQALNETLEENEKLCSEVEQLKEENRRLSDIASKAEYLENLLQEVLSDDIESEDHPFKAEQKSDPDSGQCSFVEPAVEEKKVTKSSAGDKS